MLTDHLQGIVYFVTLLLLIATSNLLVLRRLGKQQPPKGIYRVSILVPARDEEDNIESCIRSLLAQDYPDYQIIVLDDHSTDRTRPILDEIARGHSQLTILSGQALPSGWLGKHWACQQLGEASDGDLLLFTDADTRHKPQALSQAVSALQREKAEMLSALVHQEVSSWTEKLAVPVMSWSIFSVFPFLIAHIVRLPLLALANGQYILFTRQAYLQIGGHAAVRDDPVDDIALARRAARLGIRWRMVDATPQVSCRMYRHRRQVFEGFTKNLYATFGRILPLYLFIWLWMAVAFVEPWALIIWYSLGKILEIPNPWITQASLQLIAAAILLSFLQWGLVYWRLRFPIRLILIYPLSVLFFAWLAFRSMIFNITGKATWKGRMIGNP